MNHSAEPRESAAPAAGTAARALRPLLRLGVPLAVLAGLLLLGAQLITARIPQQRAALEQLLREQTGLTVSFETLTVHWGWYGPEARFHQVTLAAPGQPPLLHAPRLGVTLDLWRSARSGHLEAGHIALFGPEIELALPGGGSTRASGSTDPLAEPLRRLRDWRGGRIDLWRGTLRLADARGSALALGIEHAELRRLGARWSADAHLTLSPELGSRAHVVLRLDEAGGGTLALEGRQLNLAGWRPLATRLGAAWPLAGEAELSLNASFLRGRLQRAEADLDARSLAWSLRENGVPLEVPRLQGRWRLHRQGDGWELEAGRLALGAGADLAARLSLDAAGSVRGELHNLPLEELVALARWQGWPEAPVHLSGRVPQLSFIWDAARPRGQRLTGRAELEELRIADGADDHALQGLRAHLDATEELLRLDLEGERAQLTGADGVREPLGVSARLTLAADARGWQLAAEPLELRRAGGGLSGSVLLRGAANGAPQLDARVTVHELDLAPFAARFAAHYAPLGRLSAGRIEHGGIEVHERLDAQALQRTLSARTRGTFELHGLALEGGGAWPTLQRLDAQLALRGEQLSARARGGAVQGFAVDSARLSWHYGTAAAHLQAHLRGRAEEALGWLRAQPSLANYLPPAADFTASGALLLDLDLTGSATQLDPRSRVTAVLDGVSLQALAGLPPLQSLRGVLRLRGGSLQGTASGRWLEGPVNLSAATRAARPVPVVSLTARGAAELRGLLPADSRGAPPVSGSSEWTAQLTFAPEAGAFTVSADAPLTGVVSHLPEPLGKSPASALAAHLEAQGANGTAQVRFRLGDRVGGVLALARGAAGWRIERGAVACGAVAPALPTEAMLALSGSTPQLDLPAYLALWRQQSRAALLPPITAHLSARELLLGAVYRDAELSAALGQEGGSLELRGPGLTGSLIWPAAASRGHPAQLRLARLPLQQPGGVLAAGSGLLDLFGPALHVSIGELISGRDTALGAFEGTLLRTGERLDLQDLAWRGLKAQGEGSGHCADGQCALRLHLASGELAGALAALGWRPDLAASSAQLEGEVRWQPKAPVPLATLAGHLHMQIEAGEARAGEPGPAFPLFVVPALLGALQPTDAAPQPLQFQRLSADFELQQGNARTVNMHLDGDAEILVRGRIGLAAEDYEGEAVILRGEDRLPQAMRRLAPTPRVAALWLSLRDWFAGRERPLPTLYLRGPWQDPIVTSGE